MLKTCLLCLCVEMYLLVYTYFFCTRVDGNPLVMDPNSICRRTRTLVGRHADMCQSQPEIIQEVAKGSRLGMRECQHQFHSRRWNCTSQSRNLAKILQQGEKQYKSSLCLFIQSKLLNEDEINIAFLTIRITITMSAKHQLHLASLFIICIIGIPIF